MRAFLLLLPAFWGNALAQAPDSARVFKAARTAEAQYERAARRLAPIGTTETSGTCDEYVGRFCLYYDTGRKPLPAEPVEIARVRERAIASLRDAYALNPARTATAFPLVRLLLEDKQPAEAVAVAEQFGSVSADSVVAAMLLTLTHHANGDIAEAEHAIELWLSVVDSVERRRLRDVRWLLDDREEKRYRDLHADSRLDYEERFWRYADALYLTEGNETRTEHFSRHVENRLLETVPTVFGSTSFGRDVAELTIRFGTPKARTRAWRSSIGTSEPSITEHWDPEQMIYAPPAIDTVLNVTPDPSVGWPMDTIRSISGHAPSTIRRMLPLAHQAAVFRNADGQHALRISGLLVKDSAARSASDFHAGIFLASGGLRVIAKQITRATSSNDSMRLSFEIPIPAVASFYSAEILEDETRLAGRARYPLVMPEWDGTLFLSDVVIAEPFPAGALPARRSDESLVVRPTLVLPASQPFGVYAEITSAARLPDAVTIELELIAADGKPALLRAAHWLRERLGLADRAAPTRLSWVVDVIEPGPVAVAVTVDPGKVKPGRYIVELAAASGGRRVVARREIVLSASGTS